MASGPTIVAKFLGDTSNLTSAVDKVTSTASSSLGGFAKKAALAVGGAFAVDKIVEFGKASVDAAAADAEAQDKLAQTLKNTTGATDAQIASSEKFISNLSKQTAIADDELRPALGNLARGFGDTQKAQEALALATDVSAGTGKDLNTVTQAMMKAAQGNTGALGRLGVATKDSAGHALSLDQIMANMASTFKGQAAAAADSTAGKMRAAKVQFGEFEESVGTAVMPTVASFASMLSTTLLPALQTVFGFISSHQPVLIATFAAITVGFAIWAANALIAAAATVAAIAPVLAAAAPFIALGAVIAAVVYVIIRNWSTIVAATKAAWDAVLGAVKFVWNWIRNNWPILLAVLTGPIGGAVILIMRNWDTIRNGAAAVWNWVRSNWPLLLAVITGPIGLATAAIIRNWDTLKGAATAVYNWIRDKFNAIAGAIGAVVGTIAGAIGRIVSAIKSPINALISGWNAIEFRIPTITLPKFGGVSVLGKQVIPAFGGQTIGGVSFGFPDIPHLAAGGVLSSPTLFVGGEAGTELVTPEALLRTIIAEEGGGHYTLNIYPRTADAADVAYGFRRLELMAGLP